jgi:hypothetical protein
VSFSVEGEEKQQQVFEMERENVSQTKTESKGLYISSKSSSSTIGLDGKFESERDVQVTGDQFNDINKVARVGNGSYVESAGASEPKTYGDTTESAPGEFAQSPNSEKAEPSPQRTVERKEVLETNAETKENFHAGCSTDNGEDHAGSIRINDRRACRGGVVHIAENLVRMGEQSTECNVSGAATWGPGPSSQQDRSGEGKPQSSAQTDAEEADSDGAGHRDPQAAIRRDPRWRCF